MVFLLVCPDTSKPDTNKGQAAQTVQYLYEGV